MRVDLRLNNTLSAKLNLSNSVISSGGGGSNVPLKWGNITGDVENQEDLVSYIDSKGYLTSIPDEYVTDADLLGYQPIGDYLTEIPSEYVTETELEGKGYLTEHQDISKLATKEELSGYQIKGNYLTEIPEDYAKKSDIPDTSKFITEIPDEYITEQELNGKGYATEEKLTSALGDIEAVLDEIIGEETV